MFNEEASLARVTLNGLWGFIDKTGKEVIPIKFSEASAFKNGRAKVKAGDGYFYIDKDKNIYLSETGKMYMDKNGTVIK